MNALALICLFLSVALAGTDAIAPAGGVVDDVLSAKECIFPPSVASRAALMPGWETDDLMA